MGAGPGGVRDTGVRGPYERAAALPHRIAANHPLVDGDARTARLAAATFLAVNGVRLGGVDQAAAGELVIDVASGAEGDVARIAARVPRM
ncbi:Fic family protein [Streptomyces goshikiensis]|uniref:Fic family protein n=1 Tax=Streptomyces goshikiensis TaxID=1942 RepID=UPI0036CB69D5